MLFKYLLAFLSFFALCMQTLYPVAHDVCALYNPGVYVHVMPTFASTRYLVSNTVQPMDQ